MCEEDQLVGAKLSGPEVNAIKSQGSGATGPASLSPGVLLVGLWACPGIQVTDGQALTV